MQRRLLTVLLAVLAVSVAVPLWAGLTVDRAMPPTGFAEPIRVAHGASGLPLAEAGSLAVTGGLLLALAAAVRRTA